MKVELLLRKASVRESIRNEQLRRKGTKSPEQVLCDILNRFGPERRKAIAARLR